MKIHPRAPITASTNLRYKFVELSIVTDETIEEAVNQWVGRGWTFDSIRFVMTEASRRPAMAFISFVRQDEEPIEDIGGAPSSTYGGGESGPH